METRTQLVAGWVSLALLDIGALDDGEIDARALVLQHVLERDRGRTGAVALAGDRHLALPDEAARAVGDLVDIVGPKLIVSLLGVEARHQVALVDLERCRTLTLSRLIVVSGSPALPSRGST